jgi:Tfp pilus assembly protein PilF
VERRLALGLALESAGHFDEAGLYLNEVVRQHPDSAPAHLGLARIAAREGSVDQAAAQYRRAIDGVWPKNDNQRSQAQAELRALSAAAAK